ncbi:MAG: esterase-like activity of phytase family protein [Prevotella sp.]
MKKKRNIASKTFTILVAFVATIILCSADKQDTITIFTIGDSTMANKDISGDKQERGWGMMLQNFFTDDVIIENHAVNGRSSKSFISEGRWQKVLDRMKPGDYVFIQFGHNDEKADTLRHTEPGSTFDENLRRFVEETKSRGAHPVLFNSVVRRSFAKSKTAVTDDDLRTNSSSNLTEGDSLIDTHGAYLISPRLVAENTGTPFVDANAITHNLEQGLGREKSKSLHMIFAPGETPSLPQGRQDNTHYNIKGAMTVAGLLAEAVIKEVPALAKYFVKYDIQVAKDGSGLYDNLQKAVDEAPTDVETVISIGNGIWQKPTIPKNKLIKFVMRNGAKWADNAPLTLVKECPQYSFSTNIPPGNYSGITHITDNLYAVVSDKSENDGFFIFSISLDSISGEIKNVSNIGFKGNDNPSADAEGIAYVPSSKTIFISRESDNRIVEYNLEGIPTGRNINIPDAYTKNIVPNKGLESLSYDIESETFWTINESPLKTDNVTDKESGNKKNILRLLSFDNNLQQTNMYFYEMDKTTTSKKASQYALGVSEITAMGKGRILALEREFFVPKTKLGAFVQCKIYEIHPDTSDSYPCDTQYQIGKTKTLSKHLLHSFCTRLSLFNHAIANYEGMCKGPTLADGSQTLILISDSQNQYAGIMKDWFKSLIIK